LDKLWWSYIDCADVCGTDTNIDSDTTEGAGCVDPTSLNYTAKFNFDTFAASYNEDGGTVFTITSGYKMNTNSALTGATSDAPGTDAVTARTDPDNLDFTGGDKCLTFNGSTTYRFLGEFAI